MSERIFHIILSDGTGGLCSSTIYDAGGAAEAILQAESMAGANFQAASVIVGNEASITYPAAMFDQVSQ
ncbi:hypothetical protein [Belnapia sp. F-4-1]|uniref:hypothetical protein n=1 Tax=Belnapia sp. F-4-1 TaxID=1545443 RepID=UPI0005BE1A7A|nr:hypothetical protein [Belnapia sp. F-4-1]